LKTIARRAGLSEERVCKISNHCTRATKATDMANDGYDIQTIATVLGHSNIQTTFNSYIKMDESKIMRAFA
jgi:integrase